LVLIPLTFHKPSFVPFSVDFYRITYSPPSRCSQLHALLLCWVDADGDPFVGDLFSNASD
jgi:hypothetical protein